MRACISEPVSWLRLERYGLGELSAVEAEQVARHLAACPACGACYAHIERDARGQAGANPLSAVASVARRDVGGWAHKRRAVTAAVAGGLLSAALGGILIIARGPVELRRAAAPAAAVKGGALELELVRMDAQGRLLTPGKFSASDRWKLLLSCPPPLRGEAHVRVFQGGASFGPLPPLQLEACGNRRSLPGAFQLDGDEPVNVCVVLASAPTRDEVLRARTPSELPEPNVCVRVEPE